ncbi:short chain dehydrogenase [Hyaloraphidium curvatum]|nr:short chain dehydrogenase [Hyaloraphidium curvatum]
MEQTKPFNRIIRIGAVKPTTSLPLPLPPVPGPSRVRVTEEDRRRYQEDGVVCLRGVLSQEWVAYLRALVENVLETCGDAKLGATYTPAGKPGRFYQELDVWRRLVPQVMPWIRDGPMGQIAAELMGSSYACFLYDQLFVKEPKTEDSTPFHQDRPYWAVGGDQVCSFWVPLDPIDKATCVEYVRGSHRWREFNAIKFQPGNALYRGANLPVLPDMDAAKAAGEHEFLAWDMEPGDMIVFNAMTVHGSKGNLRMGTRRRAWAFRFVGDDHAFLDQPGREWGWPVVDLWSQGLTNGDKLVGHPDHPVVWKRPEVKL